MSEPKIVLSDHTLTELATKAARDLVRQTRPHFAKTPVPEETLGKLFTVAVRMGMRMGMVLEKHGLQSSPLFIRGFKQAKLLQACGVFEGALRQGATAKKGKDGT